MKPTILFLILVASCIVCISSMYKRKECNITSVALGDNNITINYVLEHENLTGSDVKYSKRARSEYNNNTQIICFHNLLFNTIVSDSISTYMLFGMFLSRGIYDIYNLYYVYYLGKVELPPNRFENIATSMLLIVAMLSVVMYF